MALLFIDGFDHYATADLTKKWTSITGTPVVVPGGGRRNTGCLRPVSNHNVTKAIAAGSSFVSGFAVKLSAYPSSSPIAIVQFKDAATPQVELRVNTDGTLSVARNATLITGGTSVGVLPVNAWVYIEWKVTIADSIGANSCKVRVNGADWINVPAGQDTKNTANATASQFILGPNGNMGTVDLDDCYLCDQSGAVNNDFLGDCRVDSVFPSGDGTYSEMTPSAGGTHASLVDEAAPNTTDYVSSSTVGQRDTYQLQDLAAVTGTIYGVQVNVAAAKDDAGSRTVAPMIRSGSTDSVGPDLGLSTSQLYALGVWEKNPDGNIAWTEAAVNAVEAGQKVTG